MLVLLALGIGLDIASGQSTFTGYNFSSSTTYYYNNDILNCLDTRSCNITCSGSMTCYKAQINCPDNYDCTLNCSGSRSCGYVDLRCPKGTGACRVYCSGSSCDSSYFNWTEGNTNYLSCSSSCRYITRPPIPDTSSYTLTCDVPSECYGNTIQCPDNGDCNIQCKGTYGCSRANIIGPKESGDLTVNCSNSYSCSRSNIKCPARDGSCSISCSDSSSCDYSKFNWTEGNTNYFSCPTSSCKGITRPPVPDISSYTLTCNVSHECYDHTIQCPDNGDCNIGCTGTHGCYGANIIGPKESGDLTVNCSNSHSCYSANIKCPAGDGSCSVSCNGSEVCVDTEINWTNYSLSTFSCTNTDDCRGVTYPRPDSDAPYSVECDIDYECKGNTILCPESQPCTIFCTASYGACWGADIHCPSAHNCTVFAQGRSSFYNGIVYCPESAMCNIYCNDSYACRDAVALWAPDHSYANFRCFNEETYGGCMDDILRNPLTLNAPNNNEIYNFVCNETQRCSSSVITCPTDGDCIVECYGSGSCAASTINCPINGNCYVYCFASKACYYAKVIAPVNGQLRLRCRAQYTFYLSCTGVETLYPAAFPQIPTTAAPFAYPPTAQPTKLTVQLGFEDIQETQQDIIDAIAGLEARVACATLNITLTELRERLDFLRARVQLSPTRAPTFLPTADPTNDPTAGPTRPSVTPTESPSPAPTFSPTSEPTLSPTQTWAGEFTLSNGVNDISSEDEIRFNDIWWSDQNEYDIIKRVCPLCSNDYQEIYYRVINVSNVDDYNPYQLMANWIQSADHEHEIHWNFDLYSTVSNALKRQSNWYDCKEHIPDEHGSISAFGDCTKKRNKYQACQYSSTDSGCNKQITFSIFIGEPEYYGVDTNDVSSARSINLRSMLLDDDQDIEWKRHDYNFRNEPNFNDGPKGMDNDGDGNIYILVTAKEVDVGMILTMFIIIIGLNIMILKYGCCGLERDSTHKYGAVKSIDTEYESEVVAPIKH